MTHLFGLDIGSKQHLGAQMYQPVYKKNTLILRRISDFRIWLELLCLVFNRLCQTAAVIVSLFILKADLQIWKRLADPHSSAAKFNSKQVYSVCKSHQGFGVYCKSSAVQMASAQTHSYITRSRCDRRSEPAHTVGPEHFYYSSFSQCVQNQKSLLYET